MHGLKKIVQRGDTRPGVAEPYRGLSVVGPGRDIDPLDLRVGEGPPAFFARLRSTWRRLWRSAQTKGSDRGTSQLMATSASLQYGSSTMRASSRISVRLTALASMVLVLFSRSREAIRLRAPRRALQGFEVLVLSEIASVGQILMDHGDGAADVSHFVRNGSDEDPRSCHKLFEAALRRSLRLRGVRHEHGKARPLGRAVSGKEDVGEKDVAVVSFSVTLHLGFERPGKSFPRKRLGREQDIAGDALSRSSSGSNPKRRPAAEFPVRIFPPAPETRMAIGLVCMRNWNCSWPPCGPRSPSRPSGGFQAPFPDLP